MGERVGNTPVTGIDLRERERSSLLSGGQLSSSSASFRPPPPASPSPAKLLGLSSPGASLSQQGNKISIVEGRNGKKDGRNGCYVGSTTRKFKDAANGVVRKRSLKIRDRFLRLTHAKAVDTTPKKTDVGKTRGGPKQKTPFTPGSKSREGGDSNKRKEPASLSYQGLKSTKSGVVKKAKVIRRPSSNQGKQQDRPSETGQSDSSRKSKRPAVAARKVKQLTKKHKLDGSNTHRSKKARK